MSVNIYRLVLRILMYIFIFYTTRVLLTSLLWSLTNWKTFSQTTNFWHVITFQLTGCISKLGDYFDNHNIFESRVIFVDRKSEHEKEADAGNKHDSTKVSEIKLTKSPLTGDVSQSDDTKLVPSCWWRNQTGWDTLRETIHLIYCTSPH